ncbi:MAG: hypothetical protein U9Q81_15300 [Pseudomonadota bacterium]|nr:hypothetical protein [Pseudomonadota bacterium]
MVGDINKNRGRHRGARHRASGSRRTWVSCVILGLALLTATLAAAGAEHEYIPLTPIRVLDTRFGIGVTDAGPMGPEEEIDLGVTGNGDIPATGVSAVALNVTSTGASAASFITVWPAGDPRPLASNLNTEPGQDTPNLVIARVGLDGQISFYNSAGQGHLIADVVGWFPTGSSYVPLSPLRLLDTRSGIGVGEGAVGPGETIDLAVTDIPAGGVPADGVGAVVLNVTSTGATAPSFITVWPGGEPRPDASNLNTEPGQDTPNLVITKVGADGHVSLYNNDGEGHLVADLAGWFPSVSSYVPMSPARILDTRDGTGQAQAPVGAGRIIDLQVAGAAGVPSEGASAVVFNLTSTGASAPSFVTVWPTGEPRPIASNLNTEPGQDTPNLVIAKVGKGGQASLFNSAGQGHLIADLVGWFSDAPPVTTPKDLVLGAATGSRKDNHGTTNFLPIRRNDIHTNTGAREVGVFSGLGPLTFFENITGEAAIYVDFPAHRADADLIIDVGWKGTLLALASADAHSEVALLARVLKSNGTEIQSHTFLDEEIGSALEGADTRSFEDRSKILLPLTLDPGAAYRVELELTCHVRAAFSISATTCGFYERGAWVNSWAIEFDQGTCDEGDPRPGCI